MQSITTAIVAFIAGAIASVAGFGIGSILTPLLGWSVGVKLAVAAVSIAHVTGTAVRFWTLRHRVDRRVLQTFGVMSAGGGLLGALLH
ncbi:MAG TPA: TSUP family transporter, partial [Thermoanaerobaculia bacterium]|nr:TSUP family transporter [Thermoanaerobaculia bacterium]